MGLTHFPHGVSSYGIPVAGGLWAGVPGELSAGPFFVDKTNGSDGDNGLDPTTAFATIQKAVDSAKTASGELIFIFPGTYAENVIVAKDDITFIAVAGFGNSERVGIAPAAGVALVLNQTKRFSAYNIRFAGASHAVQSDGEGSLFLGCDLSGTTGDGCKFLSATDTDFTGSGTLFEGCVIRECGGAGIKVYKGTGVCLGLQATNVNVYNCQFYLNTDDDINDDAAGGTETYYSQWSIRGCHFMTQNKTSYLDLDGGSGSTELLVSDCYFAVDDASAGNRLSSTQVALPTGGVAVACYDAQGIVDTSAF